MVFWRTDNFLMTHCNFNAVFYTCTASSLYSFESLSCEYIIPFFYFFDWNFPSLCCNECTPFKAVTINIRFIFYWYKQQLHVSNRNDVMSLIIVVRRVCVLQVLFQKSSKRLLHKCKVLRTYHYLRVMTFLILLSKQ